MIFFQEFQHFCSEIFGQVASKHSDEDEQDNRKTNQKHILQLHFWAALFWQNNHRTAKGRHRPCSGNTADMCGTGIRHRSSNTYCKEKLWKGQQLMPAVSRRRQCLEQTEQKSQPRKHQKTVPPWTHSHTTDFFVRLPLQMSDWIIFYITLQNWEFLLKWYNFETFVTCVCNPVVLPSTPLQNVMWLLYY